MKHGHLIGKAILGLFLSLGAIWVLLVTAALLMLAPARAQPSPPAPPVVVHKKPASAPHLAAKHIPQWHVAPATSPPPPPEWGLGSWLAAPFRAAGTVVGYVGAGVTNVVETPFIAVGQAWDANNCWRNMVDPRTGETKLYWICR